MCIHTHYIICMLCDYHIYPHNVLFIRMTPFWGWCWCSQAVLGSSMKPQCWFLANVAIGSR